MFNREKSLRNAKTLTRPDQLKLVLACLNRVSSDQKWVIENDGISLFKTFNTSYSLKKSDILTDGAAKRQLVYTALDETIGVVFANEELLKLAQKPLFSVSQAQEGESTHLQYKLDPVVCDLLLAAAYHAMRMMFYPSSQTAAPKAEPKQPVTVKEANSNNLPKQKRPAAPSVAPTTQAKTSNLKIVEQKQPASAMSANGNVSVATNRFSLSGKSAAGAGRQQPRTQCPPPVKINGVSGVRRK